MRISIQTRAESPDCGTRLEPEHAEPTRSTLRLADGSPKRINVGHELRPTLRGIKLFFGPDDQRRPGTPMNPLARMLRITPHGRATTADMFLLFWLAMQPSSNTLRQSR